MIISNCTEFSLKYLFRNSYHFLLIEGTHRFFTISKGGCSTFLWRPRNVWQWPGEIFFVCFCARFSTNEWILPQHFMGYVVLLAYGSDVCMYSVWVCILQCVVLSVKEGVQILVIQNMLLCCLLYPGIKVQGNISIYYFGDLWQLSGHYLDIPFFQIEEQTSKHTCFWLRTTICPSDDPNLDPINLLFLYHVFHVFQGYIPMLCHYCKQYHPPLVHHSIDIQCLC